MAFTPEEQKLIQFGSTNGKSRSETMAALQRYRSQQKPQSGFGAAIRDIPSDIRETGSAIKSAVGGGFQTSREAREKVASGELSREAGAVRAGTATAAGLVRGVGEGILGGLKLFTSPETEEKVAGKAGEIVTGISEEIKKDITNTRAELAASDDPADRKIAGQIDGLVERYETDENFKAYVDSAKDAGEVLLELAGFKGGSRVLSAGGGAVVDTTKNVVRGGVDKTTGVVRAVTPESFKRFNKSLDTPTKVAAERELVKAYETSFIDNVAPVQRALDKLADKSFTPKGAAPITRTTLVRNLVQEGYTPDIAGKLSDFNPVLDHLASRQGRLIEGINPLLETVPVKTQLSELKDAALAQMKKSGTFAATFKQAENQLVKFFDNFEEQFGSTLTARNVNAIRVMMNGRTKAFDKDAFVQDTANVVADQTRRKIDELVPSGNVTAANKEWGRLQQLRLTAATFNRRPVRTNNVLEAFGRYGGVIMGAGVGGGLVTGSGALVVAGLAAKFGGDMVAQMLRNKKFSPKAKEALIQGIRSDDEILEKLLNEASEANRATLERLLLPAPSGQTPIPVGGRTVADSARVVDAPKGEPGRTPKGQEGGGKFFKTFQSGETKSKLDSFRDGDGGSESGRADFFADRKKPVSDANQTVVRNELDAKKDLLFIQQNKREVPGMAAKIKTTQKEIAALEKEVRSFSKGETPKTIGQRLKGLLGDERGSISLRDPKRPKLKRQDVSSSNLSTKIVKNVEDIHTGKSDGFTNNLDGSDYVGDDAITTIESKSFKTLEATKKNIDKFIDENMDLYKGNNSVKVGVFKMPDGSVSVDINLATKNRDLAKQIATANNQDSFWDNKTFKVVKTGGSGEQVFTREQIRQAIDAVESDLTPRTGQQNAEFFTDKATKPSSDIPYKPVIKTPQVSKDVKDAFDTYTMGGNFTGHIAKMIPAFAEKQMAVTNAIIKSDAKSFLDIGASEGGVVKTVSAMNPKIKSVALDPNPQMRANYQLTPKVDNTRFKLEALGGSWTEDFNGKKIIIKEFTPSQKFDVINEDYAFQFINNDRSSQVKMVKEMLSDEGIFVTSEKFHTPNDKFFEQRKLDHQSKYFDTDQLTEDKQTIITGMADDMVGDKAYEKVLRENFEYVSEYWNSGNFKGYVASDSREVITKFIKDVGDVNSEFSAVVTPRVVK